MSSAPPLQVPARSAHATQCVTVRPSQGHTNLCSLPQLEMDLERLVAALRTQTQGHSVNSCHGSCHRHHPQARARSARTTQCAAPGAWYGPHKSVILLQLVRDLERLAAEPRTRACVSSWARGHALSSCHGSCHRHHHRARARAHSAHTT